MYDSVLVPTDGSENMERAVDHAVDIAERYDATLHALSVIDRRIFLAADEDTREEVRDSLEEAASDAVAEVATAAETAGRSVTSAIVEGVPHREILDYAEEHDVDLVVIGTHGLTGRDRHVNLGSVSERVVKSAECPVLVVHIDDG